MTYCFAQRLWSQIFVTCRSYWFPFWSPCLVVPGQDASGPGDGGIRTRLIWNMSPTKFECGYCEMLFFRVCGVRQNFNVFSLNRSLPALNCQPFSIIIIMSVSPSRPATIDSNKGAGSDISVPQATVTRHWAGSDGSIPQASVTRH